MDPKLIGYRIKLAREAANITQEDLAKAVDCTPQHIGAIERGVKCPKLDTFVIIANSIGASADLLLQDVLDNPIDPVAADFSAALAPLSEKTRVRILKAVRVFAEEEG